MVAEEKETAPMKIVAAGPRYDIDRPDAGHTGVQVEIEGRDLKFLDCLLGKILSRAAGDPIVDTGSVHSDPGQRPAHPGDRDASEAIGAAARVGDVCYLDARFQCRQLQKAAPVQRQVFDLIPGDKLHRFYIQSG